LYRNPSVPERIVPRPKISILQHKNSALGSLFFRYVMAARIEMMKGTIPLKIIIDILRTVSFPRFILGS
jgi:hypothetical protein